MANTNLSAAKKAKKDEFYTQLADINAELRHYTHHFEGKVVFCNCDDPYESNFFKYFAANFNALKLKRLIATCYAGSPVAGHQLELDLFGDDGGGAGAPRAPSVSSRIPHKIVQGRNCSNSVIPVIFVSNRFLQNFDSTVSSQIFFTSLKSITMSELSFSA